MRMLDVAIRSFFFFFLTTDFSRAVGEKTNFKRLNE